MHDVRPDTRHWLHRLYTERRPPRVRQRAHCLLLRSQGRDTPTLRPIFSVDRLPIAHGGDAWETSHCAGLSDTKRPGRPPQLPDDAQRNAHHSLGHPPSDGKKVVSLLEQAPSQGISTKTSQRLGKTALSGSGAKQRQRHGRIPSHTSAGKQAFSGCQSPQHGGEGSEGILRGVVWA